jgi:hypothetical protein
MRAWGASPTRQPRAVRAAESKVNQTLQVPSSTLRSLSVALTLVAVVVGVAPSYAGPSADPIPDTAWHVDGTVLATEIVGSTVVVGGLFAAVVGPSGQSVPRANLAAFDLVSGSPLTAWRADTDGAVLALTSVGDAVWVGGAFQSVGGAAHSRLAKVSASSGVLDPQFTASANNSVRALTTQGDAVFVGGNFGFVNGVARARLAKVSPSTGALDQSFAPTPNGTVQAVSAAATGPLYVAGIFTEVGEETRSGVAAVDPTSGATLPVVFAHASITVGLDVSDDGTQLFGAGAAFTNAARGWNATTGNLLWSHETEGDVQAVRYDDGLVYFGFHEGYAGDFTLKVLVGDATTGVLDPDFRPRIDEFWGVYALAVSPLGVVIGGAFSEVGGVPAQGLAIFHPDKVTTTVQVAAGARWRHRERPLGSGSWSKPGFDDSRWPRGKAQLGYGDGDESTLITPTSVAYFRKTFTLGTLPDGLALRLIADDGAVVYLNGVEVARDNMPVGAFTPTTRATRDRGASAERKWRSFALPVTALRVGPNVLAIEVHQSRRDGRDLSFAASLSGSKFGSADR